jgi:hypothetical protein
VSDPGVPGAEGSAVEALLARVPAERIDALWHFPPIRKGRREQGLLAAGLLPDDAGDGGGGDERRVLVTLAWRAEETGKGTDFEVRFQEEGEAPRDRLPRVMAGVARRMDEGAGDPRYLSVGGNAATLDALIEELRA